MIHSKFENQLHAEQLMGKGKYNKALEVVNNAEKRGINNPEINLSLLIFKAELYRNMGYGKDTIEYASKAYQLSQNLGMNYISFDALIFKFWGCWMVENLEEFIKTIDKIKMSFSSLKDDQSEEFLKRKAYFSLVQACDTGFFKKNSESKTLEFFKYGLNVLEKMEDNTGRIKILNSIGYFYQGRGDLDKATHYYEQSLDLSKRLGNNAIVAENLYFIANLHRLKGNLDIALEYANHSLKFEEITGKVKIDNYLIIGEIHRIMGNLDLSLEYCKKGLDIASEIELKYEITRCLWRIGQIKWMNGSLEKACEDLETCLKISQDNDYLTNQANSLFHLVRVNVDLGQKTKAENYLYNFDQFLQKHYLSTEAQWHSQLYRIAKGYLLKTSNRARNRGEAEILYKQVAEEKVFYYELTVFAIIELCDLLIRDMGETNDPTILTELEPYIEQLLNISKNQKSYRYMAETKLLQAKLSLLTFKIKKARQYLIQAKKIAENYGLYLLATKIDTENEDLIKKLELWEKLKETEAPMKDRLKLARLDEKIIELVFDHTITEKKIAVSKRKKTCIVCRGEVLGYSYICICGANYCENCARALTNLENVCWNCEEPIDYSKPIKPFKIKEKKEGIKNFKKN